MRRRAGGDAAGRETAEAVRKSDSKSVVSVASAEDGHSLARLERTDAASESRTSLLVMPSRKEEKAEGLN